MEGLLGAEKMEGLPGRHFVPRRRLSLGEETATGSCSGDGTGPCQGAHGVWTSGQTAVVVPPEGNSEMGER